VHTPAFAFEQKVEELQRITRVLGIAYPVAIDNGYKVWEAFGNQTWPRIYFIDHRGRIVDIRYGDGAHEDSERVVQAMLREAGTQSIPTDLVKPH
jgi:hypothetical protein